jgi:hypothetical protein
MSALTRGRSAPSTARDATEGLEGDHHVEPLPPALPTVAAAVVSFRSTQAERVWDAMPKDAQDLWVGWSALLPS